MICTDMQRGAFLLVLVLGLGLCNATPYDPCAPIVPSARGDAFPLGLVLIPGGNATSLIGYVAEQSDSLGYCSPNLTSYLVNVHNAKFAVYNLRLDRMHVLRIPYTEIIFPLANASSPEFGLPATMTVAAFRRNVASTPAYVGSGTNMTGGAGFVISLALLLRYEVGILASLQWYDMTCDSCGGRTSQVCVQQVGVNSCATPFTNCTCAGKPELAGNCTYADAAFDQCSTSINTGFLGTDSNNAAFRTGPQIQRLNSMSLVSLFYFVKDKVMTQYNAIYGSITGEWGNLQAEADAQRVEFGGGIGSASRGGAGGGNPPPRRPPSPPAPPVLPPSPPRAPLPPGFGGR